VAHGRHARAAAAPRPLTRARGSPFFPSHALQCRRQACVCSPLHRVREACRLSAGQQTCPLDPSCARALERGGARASSDCCLSRWGAVSRAPRCGPRAADRRSGGRAVDRGHVFGASPGAHLSLRLIPRPQHPAIMALRGFNAQASFLKKASKGAASKKAAPKVRGSICSLLFLTTPTAPATDLTDTVLERTDVNLTVSLACAAGHGEGSSRQGVHTVFGLQPPVGRRPAGQRDAPRTRRADAQDLSKEQGGGGEERRGGV
jgi:hypothetical protein